jgi:hypothetical protein
MISDSFRRKYLGVWFLFVCLVAQFSNAFLDSVNVHLDHILCFLGRLILCGFLGFGILLLDEPHLFIYFVECSTDLDFRSFLDRWLNDSHQQGPEEVEQSLKFGLLEDNLHVLEFDVDIVDFEDTVAIFGFSGREPNIEGQTMASEEDVHDTLVRETGESLFLVDPVSDILQIALNLRDVERELVHAAIGDLFTSHAEEIVSLEFEDVGEKILGFENQVLNDSVDLGVTDFDSRDLMLGEPYKRHTGT